MIEIKDLYKYYGERRAIGPISATLESGEIVGLLGENGAGKTTTLRILACDLLPSSGEVTLDGLDVVERPDAVRARVGYLPDTPPLYPEMSVHELLTFAAKLHGMSGAGLEKRLTEVEQLTGTTSVKDQAIGTLSHGYKQRVGIAQAIVHKPKFVVLDEPISGLDPKQIIEMRKLIRELRGDHTVLISSHNLQEISETCDRLLVISRGNIVANGTEAELTEGLVEGVKVALTVRCADLDGLVKRIRGLDGVQEVTRRSANEEGDNVATLHVQASRDLRHELAKLVLSDDDLELLELARRERELENAFLRLISGSVGPASRAADDDEDLDDDDEDDEAPASKPDLDDDEDEDDEEDDE